MTVHMSSRALSLFASAALLSMLTSGCRNDPPLDVAPSVDLQRFQGKWYEIAKLPRPTQVQCTGTTQFVTVAADKSVSIVNECNVGSASGPTRAVSAKGTVPDANVPAKLSVDFGGGFYGDYWIIQVGDHYDYAVIGHPTRDYLWILSRTPTLDETSLHAALDHAQAQKFDTSRLEYTQQSP
jgi:apolipoprotein D and lipocalin family protein